MPLYFLNSALSKGDKLYPGESYSRLDWMKPAGVEVLVNQGKVRLVQTPPLIELAGWKIRGATLAKHGIRTIDDFLEADIEIIGKLMRRKIPTIKKWRAELENWAPLQSKSNKR
jgi:hypothetical protein